MKQLPHNDPLLSLESFVKRGCPQAFKRWDGAKIEISLIDDRGEKPTRTCIVNLFDQHGTIHATMMVDADTDEIDLTYLAGPE